MNLRYFFTLTGVYCTFLFYSTATAQDDLLSLIEEEDKEPVTVYSEAGFKTTRVINAQSFENTATGVLDMKISHRFGYINGGAYTLFGLDNATIRIGCDYGVTDRLMIGAGRNSVGKTYDGFFKYKFLRQSTGKVNMPVSAAVFSSVALQTLKWGNPERNNHFSSRLFYTFQLIVGRKFSESTSFQIMPTLVHRNLVAKKTDTHDVLSIGAAGRQKISKRVAINAEYFYVLPNQLDESIRNSLSIGFDIETGGHVFQLHFTNSSSMIEKGFITETTGNWLEGEIQFGFNISRVFTIRDRRR